MMDVQQIYLTPGGGALIQVLGTRTSWRITHVKEIGLNIVTDCSEKLEKFEKLGKSHHNSCRASLHINKNSLWTSFKDVRLSWMQWHMLLRPSQVSWSLKEARKKLRRSVRMHTKWCVFCGGINLMWHGNSMLFTTTCALWPRYENNGALVMNNLSAKTRILRHGPRLLSSLSVFLKPEQLKPTVTGDPTSTGWDISGS